jgi:mannan endo-1,4-beta-mannosidase
MKWQAWLSLWSVLLVVLATGLSSTSWAFSTVQGEQPAPVRQTIQGTANLAVTFNIDVEKERKHISPWIYSSNRLPSDSGIMVSARLGGNRWTGYNWENNASNAGNDWNHSSDDFLCWALSCSDWNQPAAALHTFINRVAAKNGKYVLLTLPMAGYVAADKNGAVLSGETAPSARWRELKYQKDAPFSYPPNLNDQVVYVDELVDHLVKTYGPAAEAQVRRGYSLDNEPDLWGHTHPRLHPGKTTVAELIQKSADLAQAVKAVDPQAEIFAPVHYGFWGMKTLQDAPDWGQHSSTYDWFVDLYLDQMRVRSQQSGRRLLDVFDVHWYPEAQGCGTRIVGSGVGNACVQQARMQAPRSFWDKDYTEDSWIGTWYKAYLPLLPRLQFSIQTYYTDTKLAITEFSFGAENHISGGVAIADVLGIFGKYGVYFASFYPLEENSDYVWAAYRLYRNADGNGLAFGNISVQATTSNVEFAPVYAAIHNLDITRLHLIVINRHLSQSIAGNFVIRSPLQYQRVRGWGFDQSSAAIRPLFDLKQIQNNAFTYQVPPLTVAHFVIEGDAAVSLHDLFLPAVVNGK